MSNESAESKETIWITGASSGIGKSLAEHYTGRNIQLALSARSVEALEAISTEIQEKSKFITTVKAFPVDVTDLSAVKATHTEIKNTFGPVTTLISSAGTYIPGDTSEKFDLDAYRLQMELNYFGLLNSIECVRSDMLSLAHEDFSQPLRIVGVSSLVGYRGLPQAAGYSASKGAVINFLQSMRFEMGRKGIQVQIVNPGFVKTPLTDKNEFNMPFRITSDEAAKIMLNGIDRNHSEIHFPKSLSWIFKFLRILPYPLYEKLISLQVYKSLKG